MLGPTSQINCLLVLDKNEVNTNIPNFKLVSLSRLTNRSANTIAVPTRSLHLGTKCIAKLQFSSISG
jgi:hypothetical protein